MALCSIFKWVGTASDAAEIIKSVNWKALTGDIVHCASSCKNNLFD